MEGNGVDKNYIKLIQEFEQASSMMKPFANFIGSYFKNLIENGFSRQEALSLVESYQVMIFDRAFVHIDQIDNNDFDHDDYIDDDVEY